MFRILEVLFVFITEFCTSNTWSERQLFNCINTTDITWNENRRLWSGKRETNLLNYFYPCCPQRRGENTGTRKVKIRLYDTCYNVMLGVLITIDFRNQKKHGTDNHCSKLQMVINKWLNHKQDSSHVLYKISPLIPSKLELTSVVIVVGFGFRRTIRLLLFWTSLFLNWEFQKLLFPVLVETITRWHVYWFLPQPVRNTCLAFP